MRRGITPVPSRRRVLDSSFSRCGLYL
jgi:hypothetical protein